MVPSIARAKRGRRRLKAEEIDETEYGLELLFDTGLIDPDRTGSLMDETRQLIAIFTGIDKTSKSNK